VTTTIADSSDGSASGLCTDSYGGIRSGPKVAAATKSAPPAAFTHAHQRHRGEGSDPVGVSSRMNPTHTRPRIVVAGL
jgi:hypothetical protein